MPHLAAGSLTWLRSGVHGDLIPLKFGYDSQRDGRVRCAQVQRLNNDKPATRILGHAETRTVCHASWFGFGRKLERLGVGGRRSA